MGLLQQSYLTGYSLTVVLNIESRPKGVLGVKVLGVKGYPSWDQAVIQGNCVSIKHIFLKFLFL